jgi:hypothetical protein
VNEPYLTSGGLHVRAHGDSVLALHARYEPYVELSREEAVELARWLLRATDADEPHDGRTE